jgi:hypothetical protein
MPFDGLSCQENQSLRRHCLLAAFRRAADALALAGSQTPFGRCFEGRFLPRSVEAAVPELPGAARDLISEDKWANGRLRTRDGGFCALGAILQVSALGLGRRARQRALAHLRFVARQRGFWTVEMMNDASTHAEALAAFDEAVRLAEARCGQTTWELASRRVGHEAGRVESALPGAPTGLRRR